MTIAVGIIALLGTLASIALWVLRNRRVKTRDDLLAERKAENDQSILRGDADRINVRLDDLLSRAKNRSDSR